MRIVELLRHIDGVHGTPFKLIERYSDGEQGAFAIADGCDRRYVLKWGAGTHRVSRMEEARAVTDLLHGIGYPAPCYLFIGSAFEGSYSIQVALPGSTMRHLTVMYLSRLLEINALQVGKAFPEQLDWHREVVNTVLYGGDGYCLHSSLLQYSPDTVDLLRELQALVSAHEDEPHRTNDVVHGDFQPANILVHDQQISGVIDWDAPFAGDCSFDIATLLFYSYDEPTLRELLWQHLLQRASLNLLSFYMAHLILRQVDWSLRFHDRATIERYLSRGRTILQDIAQHTWSSH